MKHWIIAGVLLAVAACGKEPEPVPGPRAPAVASSTKVPSPMAKPAAPEADTDTTLRGDPLRMADIDAYVRGMEKENALLREDFDSIARARAADDSDAETTALFHMTSSDIDVAGAKAAGMARPRYEFVRDRIDEVQSKLDMLEGMRRMGGDSTAMQAQVGDPYAAFAADVAAALKTRQVELAALRAEAMGLRVKAAGG